MKMNNSDCIICNDKTEIFDRLPTNEKGYYTDEYDHFWPCSGCFKYE